MSTDLHHWLNDEVYPAWFRQADRLMPEFGFKYRSRYWQSSTKYKTDGTEGDSVGKVYWYANTIFGLKDFTRGFITLWDYLSNRERHSSARQTLQFLAQSVGLELPSDFESSKGPEDSARYSLWEDTVSILRTSLFDRPEARPVWEYLTEIRKYEPDEIRQMELGFLPEPDELYALLSHRHEINFIRSTLNLAVDRRLGTTHRLALPFRTPSGTITGLAVRTVLPDVQPKYLNTSGTEKGLFGFNAYLSKGKDVILTEGQLDALIIQQRCGLTAAAVSGAAFNETHLRILEKYQILSLTLCFDGDKAGKEGLRRAIKAYCSFPKPSFRLYVTALPEGHDPDSFIREYGSDAFSEKIRKAKRYYEYLADELVPPFDLSAESKETDAQIDTIARTTLTLPVEVRESFLGHIEINSVLPEIGKQEIRKRILEAEAQKDNALRRIKLTEILTQASGLNEQFLTDNALAYVKEQLRELGSAGLKEHLSPYLPDIFLTEIAQTSEGLITGYPSLDRFVRIPQGAVTLVAGRTGHGKTTFLLNLLRNLLRYYPDRVFYFFTYEEERKYITLKLINLVINKKLDERDNRTFLRNYLASGRTDLSAVETAKKAVFDRMEHGRLQIIDQPFPVERIAEAVTYLQTINSLPTGAVFLDYVQKLPSEQKFEVRQRQLQHISNVLMQDTAKALSVPLIVGAQLNRETDRSPDGRPKLHHLREAGDLEQDANLVLSVFNPAAKDDMDVVHENEVTGRDGGVPVSTSVVPLEIKALKNRDGSVNAKTTLAFNPLTGCIMEMNPTEHEAYKIPKNAMFNTI